MSLTQTFNRDVAQWGRDTLRSTRNQVLRLCLNVGPGYEQQTVSTRSYAGEANKITFAFPYYMVFVHKGAGRGYGGNKSGLYTRKDGSKGVTSQNSRGRQGSGKRVAKPWFNPVIESQFPLLADLVATYHGQKIAINIQRVLID